jgi:hypothetical protein
MVNFYSYVSLPEARGVEVVEVPHNSMMSPDKATAGETEAMLSGYGTK